MPQSYLSPLELMQRHIEALYTHDENKRIVAVNQWDGGVAPRFFLGRTSVGNAWRFRADLPADLASKLEYLCLEEPENLKQEPRHKDKYIQLLSAHLPIKQVWQGPAYGCSKPVEPSLPFLQITEENAYLLRGGFEDWLLDVPHRQPFMAVLEDDHAVSICSSVRITELAHEAGVETLTAYRRQGYAANVVAGWANTLLKKKIIPLYSTSWDNVASQKLAKKLGFSQFGTDFYIT